MEYSNQQSQIGGLRSPTYATETEFVAPVRRSMRQMLGSSLCLNDSLSPIATCVLLECRPQEAHLRGTKRNDFPAPFTGMTIEEAVEACNDINEANPANLVTALHVCCSMGTLDLFALVTSCAPKVNFPNIHSQTAIMYAFVAGRHEFVEELVKLGAHLDCRDLDGNTLMHFAACHLNDPDAVETLIKLDHTFPCDQVNAMGFSPLHIAVACGSDKAVASMLFDLDQRGPALLTENFKGETALHVACLDGRSPLIISYLVRSGASVISINDNAESSLTLYRKCSRFNLDTDLLLADAAEEEVAMMDSGMMPLEAMKLRRQARAQQTASGVNYDKETVKKVVSMSKEDMFMILTDDDSENLFIALDCGLKVAINDFNVEGYTLLHKAVRIRAHKCMVVIIEQGADLNAKSKIEGASPLIFASSDGNLEAVSILLNYSAFVDAADNEKQTALMYAAAEGHLGVIEALIEHGANVNMRSSGGSSALDMAISANRDESSRKLLPLTLPSDPCCWACSLSHVQPSLESLLNAYASDKFGSSRAGEPNEEKQGNAGKAHRFSISNIIDSLTNSESESEAQKIFKRAKRKVSIVSALRNSKNGMPKSQTFVDLLSKTRDAQCDDFEIARTFRTLLPLSPDDLKESFFVDWLMLLVQRRRTKVLYIVLREVALSQAESNILYAMCCGAIMHSQEKMLAAFLLYSGVRLEQTSLAKLVSLSLLSPAPTCLAVLWALNAPNIELSVENKLIEPKQLPWHFMTLAQTDSAILCLQAIGGWKGILSSGEYIISPPSISMKYQVYSQPGEILAQDQIAGNANNQPAEPVSSKNAESSVSYEGESDVGGHGKLKESCQNNSESTHFPIKQGNPEKLTLSGNDTEPPGPRSRELNSTSGNEVKLDELSTEGSPGNISMKQLLKSKRKVNIDSSKISKFAKAIAKSAVQDTGLSLTPDVLDLMSNAAKDGLVEVLQRLLDCLQVSGKSTEVALFKPLSEACIGNQPLAVQIIAPFCDLNLRTQFGDSLVHVCCNFSSPDSLRQLLLHDNFNAANVFGFLDKHQRNGLACAVHNCALDCADMLVHHGADSLEGDGGRIPLIECLTSDRCWSPAMFDVLVTRVGNKRLCSYQDTTGNSLLHLAALNRRMKAVHMLRVHSTLCEIKNHASNTPFQAAREAFGASDSVVLLLSGSAASPSQIPMNSMPPLQSETAAMSDARQVSSHEASWEFYLSKINESTSNGCTGLYPILEGAIKDGYADRLVGQKFMDGGTELPLLHICARFGALGSLQALMAMHGPTSSRSNILRHILADSSVYQDQNLTTVSTVLDCCESLLLPCHLLQDMQTDVGTEWGDKIHCMAALVLQFSHNMSDQNFELLSRASLLFPREIYHPSLAEVPSALASNNRLHMLQIIKKVDLPWFKSMVNQRNSKGNTISHVLASQDDLQPSNILAWHAEGAQFHLVNDDGETALDILEGMGHFSSVSALASQGIRRLSSAKEMNAEWEPQPAAAMRIDVVHQLTRMVANNDLSKAENLVSNPNWLGSGIWPSTLVLELLQQILDSSPSTSCVRGFLMFLADNSVILNQLICVDNIGGLPHACAVSDRFILEDVYDHLVVGKPVQHYVRHSLIDCKDRINQTPLHMACRNGKLEASRDLLACGSSPFQMDSKGRNCTQIMQDCIGKNPISAWLDYFSTVDLRNNLSGILLLLQALFDKLDTRLHSETGSVGNYLKHDGIAHDEYLHVSKIISQTASHELKCIAYGDRVNPEEFFGIVREQGCNPATSTKSPFSLAHALVWSGQHNLFRALRLSGLQTEAIYQSLRFSRDCKGRSPLHWAAIAGSVQSIESLMLLSTADGDHAEEGVLEVDAMGRNPLLTAMLNLQFYAADELSKSAAAADWLAPMAGSMPMCSLGASIVSADLQGFRTGVRKCILQGSWNSESVSLALAATLLRPMNSFSPLEFLWDLSVYQVKRACADPSELRGIVKHAFSSFLDLPKASKSNNMCMSLAAAEFVSGKPSRNTAGFHYCSAPKYLQIGDHSISVSDRIKEAPLYFDMFAALMQQGWLSFLSVTEIALASFVYCTAGPALCSAVLWTLAASVTLHGHGDQALRPLQVLVLKWLQSLAEDSGISGYGAAKALSPKLLEENSMHSLSGLVCARLTCGFKNSWKMNPVLDVPALQTVANATVEVASGSSDLVLPQVMSDVSHIAFHQTSASLALLSSPEFTQAPKTSDGKNPLHYWIKDIDNPSLLRAKLEDFTIDPADSNLSDSAGASAFHIAAYLGKADMLKMLCSASTSLKSLDDMLDRDGNHVLHWTALASCAKHLTAAATKQIISMRPSLLLKSNDDGMLPIDVVARQCASVDSPEEFTRLATVQEFIQATHFELKADFRAENQLVMDCLTSPTFKDRIWLLASSGWITTNQRSFEFIEVLRESFARHHEIQWLSMVSSSCLGRDWLGSLVLNSRGQTLPLLHTTVEYSNFEAFKTLLVAVKDHQALFVQNNNGQNVLHWCCKNNNAQLLEFVIATIGKPQLDILCCAEDNQEQHCISVALQNGAFECIDILKFVGYSLASPLHTALQFTHFTVENFVKLLNVVSGDAIEELEAAQDLQDLHENLESAKRLDYQHPLLVPDVRGLTPLQSALLSHKTSFASLLWSAHVKCRQPLLVNRCASKDGPAMLNNHNPKSFLEAKLQYKFPAFNSGLKWQRMLEQCLESTRYAMGIRQQFDFQRDRLSSPKQHSPTKVSQLVIDRKITLSQDSKMLFKEMMNAASDGDLEYFKRYMQPQKTVNCLAIPFDELVRGRDSNGRCILHVAASKGHAHLFDMWLLQPNAKRMLMPCIDIVDAHGNTPLHMCALRSALESHRYAVEKLLEMGAMPSIANKVGKTPLRLVIDSMSSVVGQESIDAKKTFRMLQKTAMRLIRAEIEWYNPFGTVSENNEMIHHKAKLEGLENDFEAMKPIRRESSALCNDSYAYLASSAQVSDPSSLVKVLGSNLANTRLVGLVDSPSGASDDQVNISESLVWSKTLEQENKGLTHVSKFGDVEKSWSLSDVITSFCSVPGFSLTNHGEFAKSAQDSLAYLLSHQKIYDFMKFCVDNSQAWALQKSLDWIFSVLPPKQALDKAWVNSLLFACVRTNNSACLSVLLANCDEVDIQAVGLDGANLLYIAIVRGYAETTRDLLQNGADPFKANGPSSLLAVLSKSSGSIITEILNELGAQIALTTRWPESDAPLLHKICAAGNLDAICTICQHLKTNVSESLGVRQYVSLLLHSAVDPETNGVGIHGHEIPPLCPYLQETLSLFGTVDTRGLTSPAAAIEASQHGSLACLVTAFPSCVFVCIRPSAFHRTTVFHTAARLCATDDGNDGALECLRCLVQLTARSMQSSLFSPELAEAVHGTDRDPIAVARVVLMHQLLDSDGRCPADLLIEGTRAFKMVADWMVIAGINPASLPTSSLGVLSSDIVSNQLHCVRVASICILQAKVRCFVANLAHTNKLKVATPKEAVSLSSAALNQFCITIQSNWKVHVARKNICIGLKRRMLVQVLQRAFRAYSARKSMKRASQIMYARNMLLARESILRAWRSHLAKRALLLQRQFASVRKPLYGVMASRRAASLIQLHYLKHVVKSSLANSSSITSLQKKQLKAKLLQQVWRRHTSIRLFATLRSLRAKLFDSASTFLPLGPVHVEAAVTLQNCWRQKEARNCFKAMLQMNKQRAAALCIQRSYQVSRASRAFSVMYTSVSSVGLSASTLQRAWKCSRARKCFNARQTREETVWVHKSSAVILQCMIRQWLAVKKARFVCCRVFEPRFKRQALAESAKRTQLQGTQMKRRAAYNSIMETRNVAIVCVQTAVRSFLARRQFFSLKEVSQNVTFDHRASSVSIQAQQSALLIVSMIRKHLADSCFQRLRKHQLERHAAIRIQRGVSAFCARRTLVHLRRSHAVVQLQCSWRRHAALLHCGLCRAQAINNFQQSCASLIARSIRQKLARSLLQTRKHEQHASNKLRIVRSAVRINLHMARHWLRAQVFARSSAELHNLRVQSSNTVKLAFRCKRARLALKTKSLDKAATHRAACACLLQSAWRSCLARTQILSSQPPMACLLPAMISQSELEVCGSWMTENQNGKPIVRPPPLVWFVEAEQALTAEFRRVNKRKNAGLGGSYDLFLVVKCMRAELLTACSGPESDLECGLEVNERLQAAEARARVSKILQKCLFGKSSIANPCIHLLRAVWLSRHPVSDSLAHLEDLLSALRQGTLRKPLPLIVSSYIHLKLAWCRLISAEKAMIQIKHSTKLDARKTHFQKKDALLSARDSFQASFQKNLQDIAVCVNVVQDSNDMFLLNHCQFFLARQAHVMGDIDTALIHISNYGRGLEDEMADNVKSIDENAPIQVRLLFRRLCATVNALRSVKSQSGASHFIGDRDNELTAFSISGAPRAEEPLAMHLKTGPVTDSGISSNSSVGILSTSLDSSDLAKLKRAASIGHDLLQSPCLAPACIPILNKYAHPTMHLSGFIDQSFNVDESVRDAVSMLEFLGYHGPFQTDGFFKVIERFKQISKSFKPKFESGTCDNQQLHIGTKSETHSHKPSQSTNSLEKYGFANSDAANGLGLMRCILSLNGLVVGAASSFPTSSSNRGRLQYITVLQAIVEACSAFNAQIKVHLQSSPHSRSLVLCYCSFASDLALACLQSGDPSAAYGMCNFALELSSRLARLRDDNMFSKSNSLSDGRAHGHHPFADISLVRSCLCCVQVSCIVDAGVISTNSAKQRIISVLDISCEEPYCRPEINGSAGVHISFLLSAAKLRSYMRRGELGASTDLVNLITHFSSSIVESVSAFGVSLLFDSSRCKQVLCWAEAANSRTAKSVHYAQQLAASSALSASKLSSLDASTRPYTSNGVRSAGPSMFDNESMRVSDNTDEATIVTDNFHSRETSEGWLEAADATGHAVYNSNRQSVMSPQMASHNSTNIEQGGKCNVVTQSMPEEVLRSLFGRRAQSVPRAPPAENASPGLLCASVIDNEGIDMQSFDSSMGRHD